MKSIHFALALSAISFSVAAFAQDKSAGQLEFTTSSGFTADGNITIKNTGSVTVTNIKISDNVMKDNVQGIRGVPANPGNWAQEYVYADIDYVNARPNDDNSLEDIKAAEAAANICTSSSLAPGESCNLAVSVHNKILDEDQIVVSSDNAPTLDQTFFWKN